MCVETHSQTSIKYSIHEWFIWILASSNVVQFHFEYRIVFKSKTLIFIMIPQWEMLHVHVCTMFYATSIQQNSHCLWFKTWFAYNYTVELSCTCIFNFEVIIRKIIKNQKHEQWTSNELMIRFWPKKKHSHAFFNFCGWVFMLLVS